ncbi:hypothetical protein GCM10010191_78530 [Actinomadura vinacea]|uniref:PE-PPE domain-containing protein n=1 Tax=Actinomadura vinacea TaxID=115336 RepID=A0ABP5XFK3_9ACTN
MKLGKSFRPGHDVVNALPAARAVQGLGRDWIAVGHSQGGQAAVAVGELIARREKEGRTDPGYRGLVAPAPVSDLADMFAQNAARPEGAGIAVLTVTGGGC